MTLSLKIRFIDFALGCKRQLMGFAFERWAKLNLFEEDGLFSYIDKKIRIKLEAEKKLVHLTPTGALLADGDSDQPAISLLGPIPMPILVNGKTIVFSWYAFVKRVELKKVLDSAATVKNGESEGFRTLIQSKMSVNSVLVSPQKCTDLPLVRIHSCCMTGDVFGSLRCECGPQFQEALVAIAQQGGAIVYMSSHEGRGIGLWAKAATYLLQDDGQDTYQANTSLGLPEDSRDFRDSASVLRYLFQNRPIRLLSNNPLKKKHLEEAGQSVAGSISHVQGINEHNIRYMRSKKEKGHNLPEL